MAVYEVVAIVLSVLIVGGVILKSLIDKKNGKCSCGCSGCPHYESCKKKREEDGKR